MVEIASIFYHIQRWYNCPWDWLMIKDGSGSTLLDKTCGYDLPPVVTSLTNTVDIHFHTDSSVQYKGFKLEWRVKTGGYIEVYLHFIKNQSKF